MARALLGYVGGSPTEQLQASEIARLRRRIAELEAELEEVRAAHPDVLEIELHRITADSAPALA